MEEFVKNKNGKVEKGGELTIEEEDEEEEDESEEEESECEVVGEEEDKGRKNNENEFEKMENGGVKIGENTATNANTNSALNNQKSDLKRKHNSFVGERKKGIVKKETKLREIVLRSVKRFLGCLGVSCGQQRWVGILISDVFSYRCPKKFNFRFPSSDF
ncbi:unnamed protein product [Meloidogyne enterolobii]|uniref:Uncharacterized protein n=1 Tax=Meloidogyne enterolobii TaxID=390850 RepID=A0ACB0ZP14_MELEN